MRFELEADWVAAAWAALAFALLAVAWRSERRVFLYQGLLIGFGVLFRTVLHNFYQRSYFPASGWESRWISVGAVVALLFASLPFAFQVRRKDEPSLETGLLRLVQSLGRRPEQVFFFIAVVLLTVLLALEMRHGMVTVSWGVEGVAIFLLALWLEERSFRLSGLGLLLLCVGKILVVDVWRLNPRDRYLTLSCTRGIVRQYGNIYDALDCISGDRAVGRRGRGPERTAQGGRASGPGGLALPCCRYRARTYPHAGQIYPDVG
ncbi:MAG: hypothetical protein AUH86_05160 [Acidobacteria bacterium 13_1_40CM_4_58_4]|nr:MAG: hypothetical protein AUH86_05160 [Acidobacteria bacterium 13_1_40CM_4_58_4]